MTRRILSTVIALGALITVMGFGGIYAVFTDRATTGSASVDSAPLPQGADIEIAQAASQSDCAPENYADNLTSDLFQASDIKPGDSLGSVYFCVKNVGQADVTLTWTVIDRVETDHNCTGQESTVDPTCGSDGPGELGSGIRLVSQSYVCATGSPLDTNNGYLDSGGFNAIVNSLDPLEPDETICVRLTASYPDYGDGITVAYAQMAQSDTVTWRFAFDATET